MDDDEKTLATTLDGRGVCTVRLARPQKHNAMNAAMIEDLASLAQRLNDDRTVRVVVLTGEGESFCAGGDLNWMRQQMGADRPTRIAQAERLAHMLSALNEIAKPVIGRINGQAFGGGIGLISICDVAIADIHARFGFSETKLGLIPATIAPYVLARMGEGRARRVFMSARRFDAAEAVELGLLARTVDGAELDDAVEREIAPYLLAAPDAVKRAKALARQLGPRIDAAVIRNSAERLAAAWESDDAREGIAAFFDKRKPAFAHEES